MYRPVGYLQTAAARIVAHPPFDTLHTCTCGFDVPLHLTLVIFHSVHTALTLVITLCVSWEVLHTMGCAYMVQMYIFSYLYNGRGYRICTYTGLLPTVFKTVAAALTPNPHKYTAFGIRAAAIILCNAVNSQDRLIPFRLRFL